MSKCIKCNGPTEGFKCDICGSDAEVRLEDHKCGGEHCMPKYKSREEAQVKCVCS